jgi:uncharacterized protein (TIGR03437 family)
MKCIPLFLLWTAGLIAAQPDFATGQAARAVIGQRTFTSADPNSSNTIIGGAAGIAYANNTLFVADANRFGAAPNNHRVLMFQNMASMLPAPTAELSDNTECPVCVGQASIVLGQPDFSTNTENIAANRTNLRLPTAVASDGVHLVVADTNHNRILIWNQIPTSNNAPADVVVGQPDFTSSSVPVNTAPPSATTMSGPQGVWIQNGRLYVADTQYNRVLIWNHIPTKNGVAADVVLGAPNFTTPVQAELSAPTPTASNMLNPVSVTSDGTHLFVADLGQNRVLVWDHIPATNGEAANWVIGQPDMTSYAANNAYTGSAATSATDTTNKETAVLCTQTTGNDLANNPVYPSVCSSTLNFPRFALSDGTRLFIADGGNDRILEFQQIPTKNGASADIILGQLGGTVDQATDDVNSMNTPSSLAWDGTNLYVADPFNRRITVYSIAETKLPYQSVVNAASLNIIANGSITIAGTIHDGDQLTVTIGINNAAGTATNTHDYVYKVAATDTFATVVDQIVSKINAGSGDPYVVATANDTTDQIILTAKEAGDNGNLVSYSTTLSTNAQLTATVAASTLTGGGGAAKIAPGTLVTITVPDGTKLSDNIASADTSENQLPTTLGGTQVYFNGIRSPLLYVSPTQINAQVPWDFTETTSVNAYVRSVMNDGSIMVTSPAAVSVVPANPGVFNKGSSDPAVPPVAVATHGSSYATGIISVDGTANAGDQAFITIANDRTYTYTVQTGDTLDTIRDNLIALVNSDPQVTASAAGTYDRIIIQARQAGPDGNTIPLTGGESSSAQVVVTPIASPGGTLCCANVKGSLITPDNPAVAGEIIDIYATGLGLPVLTDANAPYIVTGQKYAGPETAPLATDTNRFVYGMVGGSTADVLRATLQPGKVGMFLVELHLNSSLTTNSAAKVTIAQGVYVSSPVTIPVVNLNPPTQ